MLLQAGAGLRWTLRSILFSLLLSVLVGSMARAAAPNVELLWPQGVPAENSVQFYLALRRAGVPAEMHIYRAERHGPGLAAGIPGNFYLVGPAEGLDANTEAAGQQEAVDTPRSDALLEPGRQGFTALLFGRDCVAVEWANRMASTPKDFVGQRVAVKWTHLAILIQRAAI